MKRRDFMKLLGISVSAPSLLIGGENESPIEEITNPAAIIQDMIIRVGGADWLDKESFDIAFVYFEEFDIGAKEREDGYETLGDGLDDITSQSKSFVYLHDNKLRMAATEDQLPCGLTPTIRLDSVLYTEEDVD